MLICIFAPFLTQCVLKPWWPWTHQNSAVKRASIRVVPGWVTSCNVWFGRAKSEQYCVVLGWVVTDMHLRNLDFVPSSNGKLKHLKFECSWKLSNDITSSPIFESLKSPWVSRNKRKKAWRRCFSCKLHSNETSLKPKNLELFLSDY